MKSGYAGSKPFPRGFKAYIAGILFYEEPPLCTSLMARISTPTRFIKQTVGSLPPKGALLFQDPSRLP